jgi:hypothetical protein
MSSSRKSAVATSLLSESIVEQCQKSEGPTRGDCRQFPRFYFRTLATATIHPVPGVGSETLECYVLTRDLSRCGVSFLHPKRLSSGQRIDLAFEDGRELIVSVKRMQRLAPRCYLIGCKFVCAGVT